jgi:hypothetical protein
VGEAPQNIAPQAIFGGGVTECSLYRGFASFMAKTRQKNEIFDGGGNEVRFQNKGLGPIDLESGKWSLNWEIEESPPRPLITGPPSTFSQNVYRKPSSLPAQQGFAVTFFKSAETSVFLMTTGPPELDLPGIRLFWSGQ